MAFVVKKFGGSSVATPEKIYHLVDRVLGEKKPDDKIVIVVSAMGDTTDDLLTLAGRITDHMPKREMDMLLSTGEQISIALLASAFMERGQKAISFTGFQAGIRTNANHTKAGIMEVKADRVMKALDEGNVVIVAGFQGITDEGDITTLGRGGSDTTAVAVAAGLKADICEIYTDVDGVYTADPRVVPNAIKLKEITFGEMLELARLGAGVMQPRAVEYGELTGTGPSGSRRYAAPCCGIRRTDRNRHSCTFHFQQGGRYDYQRGVYDDGREEVYYSWCGKRF